MKAERRRRGVFRGLSTSVIVHQIHYICEFRWTCIDDLLCFLNTLARWGSSGVGPGCPGAVEAAGWTSPSPLLLSNVPLLLGSVRLRRMLPPRDWTGLPGASAAGDRSSSGIPSVRVLCTTGLKNRSIIRLQNLRWGVVTTYHHAYRLWFSFSRFPPVVRC